MNVFLKSFFRQLEYVQLEPSNQGERAMAADLFPLTLTQNDIYLDQLRQNRSPLYNVGGYMRCGVVDVERLAAAHRKVVSTQDVFGLRVRSTADGLFQYISSERTTSLPLLDFSEEANPVYAADAWQTSLFEIPLDIDDSELFRAFLIRVTDEHYRYLGLAHHLMMDGWGFSNWARMLAELYNDPLAPAETAPWREIALDDQKYAASEHYLRDKEYWAEHTQGIPPPPFYPRYKQEFAGALKSRSRRRIIDVSREKLNKLQTAAASCGAGLPQHMLAMLAVYFGNVLRQDSVVVGIPLHNRRNRLSKKMLGVFTNISPLCIELKDRNCTFGELVRNIARTQRSQLRHQRYPLGQIVRDLGDTGHRRIYDVIFNYLRLHAELQLQGEKASLTYLTHNHEPTPLMITLCEYGESGAGELQVDYNLAYLDEADISMLLERISFVLDTFSAAYDVRVADLEVLPEAELRRLIAGCGEAGSCEMSDLCIHQLFEEQVKRTPDAVAASSAEGRLTYNELNKRANIVANYLISLGIKPESLVGIFLNRTVNILVGVLGILKAGGAYVPLDPASPPQRIKTIVENGGVQIVLTERAMADHLESLNVHRVMLDDMSEECLQRIENPDPNVQGLAASNSAYVIFTSGSTGIPKGVQICHRSAAALLGWARNIYSAEEFKRVLASTSLGFDLSIFEMFGPLSVGGECVVVKDALELLNRRLDVSLINTVPSAIKALIEQDAIPPNVQVINLAGEPLPMQVVNDLLSEHRCEKVFNLYGPSEDTTYSTCTVFHEVISDTPSIGKALPGTRVYVLSPELKLAPTGSVGELYLAGVGLARGYLNGPDLTAERFIPDPWSKIGGERLYKTGDLVRYRENGDLEYLGRLDDQVKIRGYRIELGEIQKQLELLDEVKLAIVLARKSESSDSYLAAYVERQPAAMDGDSRQSDAVWGEGLQRALRASLPSYMLPASISVLNKMPLTPNGKINKQALLALGADVMPQFQYVPPETATEVKLAGLWANLLGVEEKQVGATASLFHMGGHSLLLVRLANEIRSQLGITLPAHTLFSVNDLRELASRIDAEMSLKNIRSKMDRSTIVAQGYL